MNRDPPEHRFQGHRPVCDTAPRVGFGRKRSQNPNHLVADQLDKLEFFVNVAIVVRQRREPDVGSRSGGSFSAGTRFHPFGVGGFRVGKMADDFQRRPVSRHGALAERLADNRIHRGPQQRGSAGVSVEQFSDGDGHPLAFRDSTSVTSTVPSVVVKRQVRLSRPT